MASVLLAVGLLVFLGHVLAEVFRKTRIPDVLVLMLIGIALGPDALGLVRPEDFGKVGPVVTTIALIVILFEGGTQMRLSTVGRSLGPTLALMLPTSLATVAIVAAISRPYLEGWALALTLGAILCGTSSAVVMPLLEALRMGERARTILALESALTDVLCIVATFGLLDALRAGRFEASRLVTQVVASLVVATVLGVCGGIGWLALRARLKTFPNTMFTVFAYVFVLYGLAEWMGFSGAIVALAFGITTSTLTRGVLARLGLDTRLRIEEFTAFERGVFAEAVFLLKLFFFLYLGLMIRLDRGLPLLLGALMVGAVYLARAAITWLFFTREAQRREAALTAVMAPKGLAAAVLAAMVAQTGVAGGDKLQALAFGAVLWSIVITSVLVPMVDLVRLRPLLDRLFARHALAPAGALAPAEVGGASPSPAPPEAGPAPEGSAAAAAAEASLASAPPEVGGAPEGSAAPAVEASLAPAPEPSLAALPPPEKPPEVGGGQTGTA